jgi:autotransporter-associated beta strand protein
MQWNQSRSARNVDCTAVGRLSPLRHVLSVALASIAMTACSEQSPATPAAPTVSVNAACGYSVYPTAVLTSVSGGSFQILTFYSNAANRCQWTASSSDGWIHPVGTVSGQGDGNFAMAVDPTSTIGRHGTVTVNWTGGTASVDVDQIVCTGPPTVTNVSPERQTYSASSPCSLLPVSFDVPWLTLEQRNGAGTQFQLSVDVNTGPARVGHITTGIGPLTIAQAAGNCVTAITPSSQSFSENGGSGTFTVTATPGCAWQATTAVPDRFTRISGAEGSGNGVVTFALASNSLPQVRGASFVVGGSMKFLITQSACPVTVSPTDLHAPAAGGNFSITVTSQSCDWLAQILTFRGNGTFFSIVGPASGTGSGTVTLNVAPNPSGQVRIDGGSLTVANQSVRVTQDP